MTSSTRKYRWGVKLVLPSRRNYLTRLYLVLGCSPQLCRIGPEEFYISRGRAVSSVCQSVKCFFFLLNLMKKCWFAPGIPSCNSPEKYKIS